MQSPQEQALEEILQTSTSAIIPYAEDLGASQRAKLFLEKYAATKVAESDVYRGLVKNDALSGASASFTYFVERSVVPDGIQYNIRCFPNAGSKGNSAQADRNARNLARFVQQGKLEVSLLDK